jgi:hypothetical protein
MFKTTNLKTARLATTARPAQYGGISVVSPSGLDLAVLSNRPSGACELEKLERLQHTSNDWSYRMPQAEELFVKDRGRPD